MNKKGDNFCIMRSINSEQMDGLFDLIDYINMVNDTKEMSMIEIGSYIGESTVIFASKFNNITSIDPFEDDYDMNDKASLYSDFGKVYKEFCKNIESFKNIYHIKKTSDDAYDDLKNNLFDFVYIDGLHQYEQVKKDIKNYKNIIKPSGFIGGHDYAGYFPGVIKAVDETIGKPDKRFQDKSWIKRI